MSAGGQFSSFSRTWGRPYRTLVPSLGLVQFNGLGALRYQSRALLAVYVAEPPASIFPDPATPLAVEGEPGGEPEALHGAGLSATTT